MKIISTSGTGNFKIEKDETQLVELAYKNWFSSTAKAVLNKTEIEIKPKNIWNSSFDIIHDGNLVGDIIFNWKSDAIISIDNEKYMMKAIGIWGLKFEFINENQDRICLIKPNLKWNKVKYDYDIELVSGNYDLDKLIELLIYVGFSVNLHMTATMRQ